MTEEMIPLRIISEEMAQTKFMIERPTLRDQFAMAALTGLLQQGYDKFDPQEWSNQAYAYADSMLEARKEKK